MTPTGDGYTLLAMTSTIGSVYLPGGSGTPVGTFEFIVDPEHGQHIEIGSLVTADSDEGPVVGCISDMRTVGTDSNPVAADLSRHPGERLGHFPAVRCAQVQVLASSALRPIGAGPVRPATSDEVARATNQDAMDWPIPIGAVQLADGSYTPICVDGAFVLGPEAQGLSVFGRSGMASKTSFMSVAARSAIAAGDPVEHRTAVLAFNVKGSDMVFLDHEPDDSKALSDVDRQLYAAMGLDAAPFPDVTVHAINPLDSHASGSIRDDALPLSWDLRAVWPYLSMFLPTYGDEKLQGFLAAFEDNLLRHPSPSARIDTFEKLINWFNAEIAQADDDGSDYIFRGLVHVATARRLRRMFSGLQARGRGLFAKGLTSGSEHDIPDTGWRHGEVRVVDLAGLPTEVQGFVIARTLDRLMRSAEGISAHGGTLGVDHLVVLTDELNTWAPAGAAGDVDRVKKSLQRVATQGRYAGISLFGAAQAASRIDDLLRDNCATKAIGQSAENELTSGVHGRLSSGLTERIATLPKGQMAVWHAAFRQALVVQFPRPAWRMGKSKTTAGQRATPQSVLREHLGERAYERATRSLDDDQIDDIVAGSDSVEDATEQLFAAGDPTPNVVHYGRSADLSNPFELDT